MKAKLPISLFKAIITTVVENYNPYANMAVVVLFFRQSMLDYACIVTLAMEEIAALAAHLNAGPKQGIHPDNIISQ